jgi:hypothetical protein
MGSYEANQTTTRTSGGGTNERSELAREHPMPPDERSAGES